MQNVLRFHNLASGGYFLADYLNFDDGAIPHGANAKAFVLVVGERAHVSLSTRRYMGELPTEGFCEFCCAGHIAIA